MLEEIAGSLVHDLIRVNVFDSCCSGSLLSLVESHALMVVEVFRYDQTLPCKPGSWTA
jgi:hypothetical protein